MCLNWLPTAVDKWISAAQETFPQRHPNPSPIAQISCQKDTSSQASSEPVSNGERANISIQGAAPPPSRESERESVWRDTSVYRSVRVCEASVKIRHHDFCTVCHTNLSPSPPPPRVFLCLGNCTPLYFYDGRQPSGLAQSENGKVIRNFGVGVEKTIGGASVWVCDFLLQPSSRQDRRRRQRRIYPPDLCESLTDRN